MVYFFNRTGTVLNGKQSNLNIKMDNIPCPGTGAKAFAEKHVSQ